MTNTTKTYDVVTYRDGPWTMVSIPEIDGLTQATSAGEVEAMARDYIAVTLDVPTNSFEIAINR